MARMYITMTMEDWEITTDKFLLSDDRDLLNELIDMICIIDKNNKK